MKDDTTTELNAAIERLYEVFGVYAAPAHPAYCQHCVTEPEDVVLRTKPLRDLTADELSRYSMKAISTWGTVEQFKYLLPRLFQLIVEEGFGFNPEILFGKPRYGEVALWPGRERIALQSYCDALWHSALASYPVHERFRAFSSIDVCLCSVGQIVDELEPMLKSWDVDTNNNTLHLADFAAENATSLFESGTLSNAFWDGRSAQMKQVADWFLSLDLASVFDLVELGTMPYDFREELVQAVKKRYGPTK
jgi:hypothetical protein